MKWKGREVGVVARALERKVRKREVNALVGERVSGLDSHWGLR